jgi:hypothetical protein
MNTVIVDRTILLQCLQDLDYIVVSLDHLGSAELSFEERTKAMYGFAVEGNLFARLASVRHLLVSSLDKVLSDAERHEMEAMLEAVQPWQYKNIR